MAAKRPVRRRSFGTLRTMRNKRIQASYIYDGDGKRYYALHTYDSRTDAEGWLANERKLMELGEWSPPESRAALKTLAGVTLREYTERWMEQRDVTPKTRSLYTRLLNTRILPELGDEILRAVTPARVRAWWVDLGKRLTTPTSNTQAYQLLKAIYNTAVEDKAASENPCQIKSAGKPPKARDVKPLSPAELVKVAAAAPDSYRAAVPILAWCGLRFGELIELRRKDIHDDGRHVTLKVRRAATRVDNKLVVGPPKTDAGVRDVTLTFLRGEGLIHQDRRGGRGGDGSTWASEYSLQIPKKWSDAATSLPTFRQSHSATSEYRIATTESQTATSARQSAAHVTDHQIPSTTSDSSDPRASDPAPAESELCQLSEGRVSITPVGRFGHIPGMSAPEPDWDAMAAVGTARWDDEPPF